MALVPGTRLGIYHITAPIGEGGMGQVYRARDTKLDRDVAIKILPEAFAHDADRLARFTREAKTLASLNHPNIAGIYGLEESDGVVALVMELVEGEDLSERIARRPTPLDEALPIAKQIAEALEAAHGQGIIHRDLKPANIKVRDDGTVKVLDFGLAKMVEPPASSSDMTQSPTITTPAMTQAGMILGTAAYMSPEQAKGRQADKRSDVWAFGCVLFEMLAGKRPFSGDDVADTLAMVLKGEVDYDGLPSSVPIAVRTLIQGCLRKDRKERIADISTALFILGQLPAVAQIAPSSRPSSSTWKGVLAVVSAALIGAAIVAISIGRPASSPPAPVARLGFLLPKGQTLTVNRRAVAFSPDGTRIVYSADGALYLRSLADFEPKAIRGANPGTTPVFSPDGQSLIFYGDSAIKRVAADGGTPVTIYQIGAAPSSMFWAGDSILFSDEGGTVIMRVSPNGGKPEILLDLRKSDDLAYSPQLLPDDDTLLFSIVKRASASVGRWDAADIVVQSLRTGVRKRLIEGGSDGRYLSTGHIVYLSDVTLFAVPFDLSKQEVTGAAVPVVDGVNLGATFGVGRTAHFAFANSGSLVYVPGPMSAGQDLLLFDRNGGATALGLPTGTYEFPRVSPDGKRIAFGTSDGKKADVSVYEVSGASSVRRLTFDGNNRFPIWSGDGTHVAFQSDRGGDLAIFWQPADGGKAERLTTPDAGTLHVPESWSPAGDVLLFSATKDFVSSLWTLSLRDRTVAPFSDVKGSTLPTDAMFSPDGRWVAYQMGTQGTVEATTYAQPFPPTGTKFQVGFGGRPLWSRDGKELFLVPAPGRFVSAAVRTTASTLTVMKTSAVPRGFGSANPQIARTFDVMPDGRILGVGTLGSESVFGVSQVRVVVNWFDELKAKVPTKSQLHR